MSAISTFEMESPAWLRSMRWLALFGMAAAVVGARLYGVSAAWVHVDIILGILAVWNFLLPLFEERFFKRRTKELVFFQILVDLTGLTAILWWSGGLINPFVSFYIFHVMIAGLLLRPLFAGVVSFIAANFVLFLTLAPSLSVRGQVVHIQDSPLWFGIPIGMILLIYFTNAFILAFLSRLGRAQDGRRQRSKMDALVRLVGGLAHELGTPLNSILVLSHELAASTEGALKTDAETIHNQAKRCGDIVSLLLGYSRGLVRVNEIHSTRVKLSSWLQDSYTSIVRDPAKHANPIQLSIELDGVPEEVGVPELVLRQALVNVFKNAQDACEHIKNAKIHVRVHLDFLQRELFFEIQDNGPGFAKETKERAFEAFFTTKAQENGTGLGLYISYYLLSQVGGSIVVSDDNETGAKIIISVPFTPLKGALL